MHIESWWIWMAFAAILIIGEIFTAGFFIFWFGIGAVIAGVFAMLGFTAVWQWGIFIVVSGVLFSVSRPFAERFTKKQPPGIGADRFIGKSGIVLQDIDHFKNNGRVRLESEEWRAESESEQNIPKGTRVLVLRVEGTRLIVKPYKED